MQPNIYQVAKEAGVSPATVSRVFRNRDIVREETALRVDKAVNKLGYKNDTFSNSINNKKLNTIAVVLPDVTNPFFGSVMGGIIHAARNHKIQTIICDSQNDTNLENEYLLQVLDQQLTGLILSPVTSKSKLIDRVIDSGMNLVLADRIVTTEKKVSRVISDDFQGSYQATKYLINLGHRDILYLGTYKGASTESERLRGYCSALEDNNIAIRNELITEKQLNSESIQEKVNLLFNKNVKFTAIFAADDLIAIEAMKTICTHGMRIPEDISIVGYGDMIFVNQCELTTVAVPSYEIGRNAMILMSDLIENRVNSHQEIILKPSIVIRSSCSPI